MIPHKTPTSSVPCAEPHTELTRVLSSLLKEPEDGSSIDAGQLQAQYPHLMPELGVRLKTLQAIRSAAHAARGASSETAHTPDQCDFQFWQAALTDYELHEQMKHGAQGIVFRATQLTTGRTVALKVLRHGPTASANERIRFEREVELISRLEHPHIVRVYDSGIIHGRYYFSMEFIDGLPIDDHALLYDLNIRDRVGLFMTVCQAISSAHQQGVVHRDIKPGNILIDHAGQPHVLDFGLAKDLSQRPASAQGAGLSLQGQIVGTTYYLSPEQAAGDTVAVDTRSDIYTLGVLLYYLLSDTFPYPVHPDALRMRDTILMKPITPLRDAHRQSAAACRLNADVINSDLEAIVHKCLEKDKALRYRTVHELVDDLERYLQGDAVQARGRKRWYLWRKAIHRHRATAAIAALFVVVILAGIAGTSYMWQKSEHLARTYLAALNMSSSVTFGSYERDQGRVDQAIMLWEKALEICEEVHSDDPHIQRFHFQALQRLADLLYEEEGEADRADRYCRQAVAVAEEQVSRNPDDPEWQRMLCFAYRLRAEMAESIDDWQQAAYSYKQGLAIRRKLLKMHPDNASLKAETASLHGRVGECHRRLKQFEQAKTDYDDELELREELLSLQPDSGSRIIELAYAYHHQAVWHISQKTTDHDHHAADWLNRARELLHSPNHADKLSERLLDMHRLEGAITQNVQLLSRRNASARAQTDSGH